MSTNEHKTQEILKRYVAPLSTLLSDMNVFGKAAETYAAQADHYAALRDEAKAKHANVLKNVEDMKAAVEANGISFPLLEKLAVQAMQVLGDTGLATVSVEDLPTAEKPVRQRKPRAGKAAAPEADATTSVPDAPAGEAPLKRRGRPPGSKNKVHTEQAETTTAAVEPASEANNKPVADDKPRYPDPASQIDLEEAIAEVNARQAEENQAQHVDAVEPAAETDVVFEAEAAEVDTASETVETHADAEAAAPPPVAAPAPVTAPKPINAPVVVEAAPSDVGLSEDEIAQALGMS